MTMRKAGSVLLSRAIAPKESLISASTRRVRSQSLWTIVMTKFTAIHDTAVQACVTLKSKNAYANVPTETVSKERTVCKVIGAELCGIKMRSAKSDTRGNMFRDTSRNVTLPCSTASKDDASMPVSGKVSKAQR